MIQYIYLYLATIPLLVIGDLLWVGVLADKFYNSHIAHLRGEVQWLGAILFYLVYTLGIIAFVVAPHSNSFSKTLIYGALLGLVTYGVYNFTNHAVLNNWPLTVVIADILWGIALTAGVSAGGYYLAKIMLG